MDFTTINVIPDIFFKATLRYSKRDSLSFFDETPLTYQDVRDRALALARMLREAGIGPEDRVAILSENSPFWGVAYFAVSLLGAVAVPVLPDFQENEAVNILRHSGASAAFVSARNRPKLKSLEGVIPLYTLEEGSLPGREAAQTDPSDLPEIRPEDLATIIYTSGTTGSPKGVMLTHGNIISNVLAARHIPPLRAHDKALSVLPLAHTYECTLGFLIPFLLGTTIFYLRKPPSTSVLLPAFRKIRPGMMLTVPLLMEKIYSGIKSTKIKKSPLLSFLYRTSPGRRLANLLIGIGLKKTFGGKMRFYGIGGAPLSEETERFLRQARFPYAIGYGLTETSPLLAGDNARYTRFRATGRFLEGIEYRIEPSEGDSEAGELVVRGPNVMKGYYLEPEKTAEVLSPDGWFRTGDLVTMSKGYLTIRGRAKNMILGSNGENIYPENIENLISRESFVEECLVFQDTESRTLVARIHLNYDNLMEHMQGLKQSTEILQEDITQYLQDIKSRINRELSRFSRIGEVLEQKEPFLKTPTLKIKRFLYSRRDNSGPDAPVS